MKVTTKKLLAQLLKLGEVEFNEVLKAMKEKEESSDKGLFLKEMRNIFSKNDKVSSILIGIGSDNRDDGMYFNFHTYIELRDAEGKEMNDPKQKRYTLSETLGAKLYDLVQTDWYATDGEEISGVDAVYKRDFKDFDDFTDENL